MIFATEACNVAYGESQGLPEMVISCIGIVIAAAVAILVVFLQHWRLVRFEVEQSIAGLQAICVEILEEADIILDIEAHFDNGRFRSIVGAVGESRQRAYEGMYKTRPLSGKLKQFGNKRVRSNTVDLERSLTLLTSMLFRHEDAMRIHVQKFGRAGLAKNLSGSQITIIRYIRQVLENLQKLIEDAGGHYVEPSFLDKEDPFGPLRQ